MPSEIEIEISDGNLVLDVEIGAIEELPVELTQGVITFNALTGPGFKGEPGLDGIDGIDGIDGDRGPKGDPGLTLITVNEILSSEFQDGVNVSFPFQNEAFTTTSIQVFRNGLLEVNGLGYTATTTHVTFTTPPLDSDIIVVVYEKVQ